MNIATKLYRKLTFTGLYTNFMSFTPLSYKIGLIKSLLYRTFKINNTWQGFNDDLQLIHNFLQKNSYPQRLLEKITNLFITQHYCHKAENKNCKNENIKYSKLPYIGKTSYIVKEKVRHLSTTFCKNITVQLVFSSFKIGSYFSYKDMVPPLFKSRVIYEFVCLGCNAKYIGLTTRHLGTRIAEHLNIEKNASTIATHLKQNIECGKLCNKECFKYIDFGETEAHLRIKEALHIMKEKPVLNIQVRHENVLLFT